MFMIGSTSQYWGVSCHLNVNLFQLDINKIKQELYLQFKNHYEKKPIISSKYNNVINKYCTGT